MGFILFTFQFLFFISWLGAGVRFLALLIFGFFLAVELIRMAFKQHGYSDERLKNYDMELNLLLKSLSGGLIVTCPCCGHQFDYDNEPEHTFSQEVQDAALEFVSSIARNEARRQIDRYRPEIQAAVSSIIDGMAATKKELTTKSIADAFAYALV